MYAIINRASPHWAENLFETEGAAYRMLIAYGMIWPEQQWAVDFWPNGAA